MVLSTFTVSVAAEGGADDELEKLLIGKIETTGNYYVSSVKIIAAAQSREGQLFNAAQAGEDAERIAIIQIHQYHAIRDSLANEGSDSPVVQATSITPITFLTSIFSKTSDTFNFYPEENEQGMRCVSGPNSYD